jgi:ubiquinol-cytochrome c reductase cytochrome c subunit
VTTLRRLLVLAALVPALGVGACSYFDHAEPYRPSPYYPPADAEAVALGQQLYQRDCSFCHGREARGTPRGPDLTAGANGPALTDFVLRTGRMPTDDPDEQMRPGPPTYDEAEVAALVAYLDETFDQPGPRIPTVDPADADLTAGQRLYQEHCAACHATTGIGGAMLAREDEAEDSATVGVVIPGLHDSSSVEVAEAVRTGPGAMPRFGEGVVDDEDIDAVVAYVQYLRDPDDNGGVPIGRIGPVAEGAVGWLFGLGALLLFIRWVGTKRGDQV